MTSLSVLDSLPVAASTRVYERPVPREWVEALAEVYPHDPMTDYPIIVWEPGYDWVLEGNKTNEVVERFMLYRTMPVEAFNPSDATNGEWNQGVLDELRGPSPESLRQVIRMPSAPIPGTVRIIPGTGIVNQRTWEIFRATGRYAQPIWCIQGSHGGTPMRYQPIEQMRCRLQGLPSQPPDPGTLPYAEFDQRVIVALKQREEVYDLASKISKRKRQVGYFNKEQGREALRIMDRWLNERSGALAEHVVAGIKRNNPDLPVTSTDWGREQEMSDAREEAAHNASLLA